MSSPPTQATKVVPPGKEPRRPSWLTVAIAGSAGLLCGVLLVALLGGPKGTVRTTTDVRTREVTQTKTETQTRTVDARPSVPELNGVALDEAESQLDALGLTADVISDSLFGIVDPSNWVVVSVEPPAGAKVQPGSSVRVTVERR